MTEPSRPALGSDHGADEKCKLRAPAELFAAHYAKTWRARCDDLFELGLDDHEAAETIRAELEPDWTTGEGQALLADLFPGLCFEVAEARRPLEPSEVARAFDDTEREVWPVAIPYRVGGTAARWTGQRWAADDFFGAEGEPVPPGSAWTVVRSLSGGNACKRFELDEAGCWVEADAYGMGGWFALETLHVRPGAAGLADLFAHCEADRTACVVRGIRSRPDVTIPHKPRRHETMRGVRRAYRGEAGAFLAPHPIGQRGVIFDVDKAPSPPWLARDRAPSPEEARRLVREVADLYLPATWAGCALAYRWSQSAGVRPWHDRVSMHIGIWLERPIDDRALSAWVKTWGKPVDPKTCVTSHPIYLAAPIFEGGPDPLTEAGIPRCGFLEGDLEAVPVPPAIWSPQDGVVPLVDGPRWERHAAEVAETQRARRVVAELRGALTALETTPHDADAWIARYVAAALSKACGRVAGAAAGVAGEGRHDTLAREAIGGIGGLVAGGHLPADDAREALLAAFLSATGGKRSREAADAIRSGFAKARPISRAELLSKRKPAERRSKRCA